MSYVLPTRSLVKNEGQQRVERPDLPRSRFIGSWTRNTTFNADVLVPFMVEEVLPGDHLKYDVTAYIRMATPLFPMFDGQSIDTFFFFVPNRLVWGKWVNMMGEQDNPADSVAFTVPVVNSGVGGFQQFSIYDHMGIPVVGQTNGASIMSVNAMPFRAYDLIYHEWFRDQNLQGSTRPVTTNGPDGAGQYTLRRRNKRHDYFTSALPWPQKFTAPNIPLAGILPVQGIGMPSTQTYAATASLNQPGGVSGSFLGAAASNAFIRGTSAGPGAFPDVFVSLANSAGIPLNTLRQSWMVQALYERDARGGTRYTEILRSHFGVMSPDYRLQRPEYIGGGSSPLVVTPVAQTAPGTAPVGNLGAAATSVGQHTASYASTEHGFIIGLINIQSELSYQQGLHKMWRRQTKLDYYWPSLALLGEQAILNEEVFSTGQSANDTGIFGYQERWQEYRTRYSEVTSRFRSTASGPLDAWHLSQRFLTLPVLNSAFIQSDTPMSRVLAAGALADNQQYLANILIKRDAVRPLPMFGTPATIGRF